ncbi:MAG: 2-oxoacid:acceptor oxidoreductase subunit alpha [Bacillota bacterium]|nr:2-oxoacid:acceptor oxidoreductase subunit alpha [Bacillota bacterium]
MEPARLVQGNEACVQGAIAAGCRFFAGYPITPSTEVAELMAERLPRLGGKFIQMEDEIASMAAIIGASLCGAKAMTATSGPGFSLKQENIGFAAMCEVPCVVVNVQRAGPSTGGPTAPGQGDIMQARWGTHGDHPIVVLAPYSVRDTFDLTVAAFNCAEDLRVPTIVLLDEVIGHMRERVELPGQSEVRVVDRRRPDPSRTAPEDFVPYAHTPDLVPEMADFGSGYRHHITGLNHDERGRPFASPAEVDRLVRRLNGKMSLAAQRWGLFQEVATADAEVLVIAAGSPARSAKEAVRSARQAGIKAGLLILQTIWPFPAVKVADLASRARVVIVPELNLGQLVGEVERYACRGRGEPRVVSLTRVDTELFPPAQIYEALREVR